MLCSRSEAPHYTALGTAAQLETMIEALMARTGAIPTSDMEALAM